MNEWGFGGEIKSWWDHEIGENPDWALSRCELEQSTEEWRKRADLTLMDDSNQALLVLELRLPDHANPSPLDMENVRDASTKASMVGARWSATSDGAALFLADNHIPARLFERLKPEIRLSRAATRDGLNAAGTLALVRDAWVDLLHDLVPILSGQAQAPTTPPDEFFVESLRVLLARPVSAIRDAVSARKDTDAQFRADLITWMVDQQSWSHSSDKFEEEVANVAALSAYVFTSRLLFYEALRRAQPVLDPIDLPAGANPAATAAVVCAAFDQARVVSGDYETVFVFDDACKYSLINQNAVEGWQRVLAHLANFELNEIGYDVLGRLFERLISPEERYEWGQHYTNPDVVDFMLSLAIPDGAGPVMDPAQGGGTFLVRGYVRKAVLVQGSSHQDRLAELIGCDQSAFAASIATISLAARDLTFNNNYPRIKTSSFFERFPGEAFVSVPHASPGHPPILTPIVLPKLTAVVCNPPYIAFKNIGPARKQEMNAALLRSPDSPRPLSHKYNYHLGFWLHSATFLKEDGRLVFITSGEWMDSDYGAQLQEWLLRKAHVELVMESMAEPWFTEARVGTVVLSARLLKPGEGTAGKDVRFVTLRKPLRKLYCCAPGEDDAAHIGHVDALRDRFLALTGMAEESDDFDWSVIDQDSLRERGMTQPGRYDSAPWRSLFLRAPKIALELAARDDFTSLEALAEVKLGLKSGDDDYFFVETTGRANGTRRPIKGFNNWEAEIPRADLLPAIRGPKDLDKNSKRLASVPTKRGDYAGTRYYFQPRARLDAKVREYVQLGEAAHVNERRLVRDNADEPSTWYRQTRNLVRSKIVLSYNSQYNYPATLNQVEAVLNGRLVGVDPHDGVDLHVLAGLLNSTVVTITRLLVGVTTGSEGAIDISPPSAKTIRVPDPRNMTERRQKAIGDAMRAIVADGSLPPAPGPDGAVNVLRRNLDIAVLSGLGMTAGGATGFADRLYKAYARWRKSVESVEDQMQVHRRALSRRGGVRTGSPVPRAARTVWDEMESATPFLFADLVGGSYEVVDPRFRDRDPNPDQDALFDHAVVIGPAGQPLDLADSRRVDLARYLRSLRVDGPIPLPLEGPRCQRLERQLIRTVTAFETEATERAGHHVSDDLVEQVVTAARRTWLSKSLTAMRAAFAETVAEGADDGHAAAGSGPSLFDTTGLVPELEDDAE